jgi:hypothetical protein
MNTRGQFYLISAILIVSLIIGFAAVSNYLTKTESTELQDFAKELEVESQHVLDYATKYGEDVDTLLTDFSSEYNNYVSDKDLYFIFGQQGDITVLKNSEIYNDFSLDGNDITLSINEVNYIFEITKGENFYYVVTQEIGGEYHVVAG